MEKALRNSLRNSVTQCRRMLEPAILDVLQGQFGIHATGRIEPAKTIADHLSSEDMRFREELLAHLEHIQGTLLGGGAITPGAVEQLAREAGYTHLNRLCAYKMLEQRKLIREAVGRGVNSNGFKFYLADHDEDEQLWSSGKQDIAYQRFLTWLATSLSSEIGALFSPSDPANRLFPPFLVLEKVLALMNSTEIAAVWNEDETIGWIYQYYTPKELRDQARKESAAPRNSYELSFRNQFYTPSYVVQFLVENTLGRLWYEMRQGRTALVEQCQYMIRKPYTVFLRHGEQPPAPFHPTAAWPDPDHQSTMWTRPNPALNELPDMWKYALTVDAESYALNMSHSGEDLADERFERYRQRGVWEGTFEELRICLVFEYRFSQQGGKRNSHDRLADMRALNRAICARWDYGNRVYPIPRQEGPAEHHGARPGVWKRALLAVRL